VAEPLLHEMRRDVRLKGIDAETMSQSLGHRAHTNNVRRRLNLVEFLLVFLGRALIASGERFRDAGDVAGFHEQEIA
jgi:hypothetical protein